MNLDAMEHDDLMAFWREAAHHPIQVGRRLFPERPKGYAAATKRLANYASNKATAMACRLKGRIAEAQQYETICDKIYEALPGFARW